LHYQNLLYFCGVIADIPEKSAMALRIFLLLWAIKDNHQEQ